MSHENGNKKNAFDVASKEEKTMSAYPSLPFQSHQLKQLFNKFCTFPYRFVHTIEFSVLFDSTMLGNTFQDGLIESSIW